MKEDNDLQQPVVDEGDILRTIKDSGPFSEGYHRLKNQDPASGRRRKSETTTEDLLDDD